jgi:flavin reductase
MSHDLAVCPQVPVERAAFRSAMAHLAAAVHVITTDGPHGRAGFTATAVCSVTDQPPTLLVCINRDSSAFAPFTGNGSVCVNTLANGHETLSNAFGGKTPQAERFALAHWTVGPSGAPMLNGATLAFDCKVSHSVSVGTHDILFCEVVHIRRQANADVLVYFNRGYHPIGLAPAVVAGT